jgi:asparagine synthase (glutamine-hydrolysing)
MPYKALVPRPYWSFKDTAEAGIRNPFPGSEQEAASALERVLLDSVAQEMVADVPLGAFLSGGIDSSTIVALMQALSSHPVRTFTIGFHENGYNEATNAKAVAQHLGTDHTELYITPEEAMTVIPRMPILYDEPFSDSSQIPTFLISELTRKYVTISLSGDGGDELFGGYTRYFTVQDMWNKIKWMPLGLRKCLAITLRSFPANVLNRSFQWAGPCLEKYGGPGPIGGKVHKIAEVLSVTNFESLYRRSLSHWKDPESVVLQGAELPTAFTEGVEHSDLRQVFETMMYLDMIGYLPDNILVKVDRAAMGVGLETRVPFLDHRIVEFAWQLPLSMKTRNSSGKWLLRQVLYKYVPRELIDRPKTGFGVPIAIWLRGPLRDWAEALLDEKCLRVEGFFNPKPLRQKWEEHLSGERDFHHYLWDILMFQAWKDYWH